MGKRLPKSKAALRFEGRMNRIRARLRPAAALAQAIKDLSLASAGDASVREGVQVARLVARMVAPASIDNELMSGSAFLEYFELRQRRGYSRAKAIVAVFDLHVGRDDEAIATALMYAAGIGARAAAGARS